VVSSFITIIQPDTCSLQFIPHLYILWTILLTQSCCIYLGIKLLGHRTRLLHTISKLKVTKVEGHYLTLDKEHLENQRQPTESIEKSKETKQEGSKQSHERQVQAEVKSRGRPTPATTESSNIHTQEGKIHFEERRKRKSLQPSSSKGQESIVQQHLDALAAALSSSGNVTTSTSTPSTPSGTTLSSNPTLGPRSVVEPGSISSSIAAASSQVISTRPTKASCSANGSSSTSTSFNNRHEFLCQELTKFCDFFIEPRRWFQREDLPLVQSLTSSSTDITSSSSAAAAAASAAASASSSASSSSASSSASSASSSSISSPTSTSTCTSTSTSSPSILSTTYSSTTSLSSTISTPLSTTSTLPSLSTTSATSSSIQCSTNHTELASRSLCQDLFRLLHRVYPQCQQQVLKVKSNPVEEEQEALHQFLWLISLIIKALAVLCRDKIVNTPLLLREGILRFLIQNILFHGDTQHSQYQSQHQHSSFSSPTSSSNSLPERTPTVNLSDTSDLHASVCLALMELLLQNESAQIEFLRLQGVRAVIRCLYIHSVLSVHVYSCLCIASLTATTQIKNAVSRQGVLSVLVNSARTFESVELMQEVFCAALTKLSYMNKYIQLQVPESGAASVLLQALKHFINSCRVVRWSCEAIANITCQCNMNATELRLLGGFELILQAMQVHILSTNAASLFIHAFGALANLFSVSSKNQDHFREVGGFPIILSVLKTHLQSPAVLKCAFVALANFVFNNKENKAQLCKHGLGYVLLGMDKHWAIVDIQYFGAAVLANAVTTKQARRTLRHLGGLRVLTQTIQRYDGHQGIVHLFHDLLKSIEEDSRSPRFGSLLLPSSASSPEFGGYKSSPNKKKKLIKKKRVYIHGRSKSEGNMKPAEKSTQPSSSPPPRPSKSPKLPSVSASTVVSSSAQSAQLSSNPNSRSELCRSKSHVQCTTTSSMSDYSEVESNSHELNSKDKSTKTPASAPTLNFQFFVTPDATSSSPGKAEVHLQTQQESNSLSPRKTEHRKSSSLSGFVPRRSRKTPSRARKSFDASTARYLASYSLYKQTLIYL